MGEERRENDVRIALLEQSHQAIEGSLIRIEKKQDTIESKLDTYNAYRERLDNACKALDEHRKNHWQALTLYSSVVGLIVGVIIKVVFR